MPIRPSVIEKARTDHSQFNYSAKIRPSLRLKFISSFPPETPLGDQATNPTQPIPHRRPVHFDFNPCSFCSFPDVESSERSFTIPRSRTPARNSITHRYIYIHTYISAKAQKREKRAVGVQQGQPTHFWSASVA
ncbi:hypothetical protein Zmor_007582 [Zophobas morio]|uniref:Uncharacterized protein n=1 Tax=Zophobas morio TaxID=2755281 RepID=A0AA38MPG5_9CUCU|nr:hypothetical protein Zmor_007582 [Zophobas morio]